MSLLYHKSMEVSSEPEGLVVTQQSFSALRTLL